MVTSLLSVVSTTGGSFDVHPQPVDLSAGGGEVTLQLQLSLSQSETGKIFEMQFW